MIVRSLIVACLLAAATALTGNAQAEMRQLRGSYIQIDVPAGFEESTQFSGLLWADASASVLVVELPVEAFGPVSKDLLSNPSVLSAQGIALTQRETLSLGGVPAQLGHGQQKVGGQTMQKWLLLAGAPKATYIITAQIPTELATPERAARMGQVLRSVRFANARTDPRAVLPFTFAESEHFRFDRTLSGSAALLVDGSHESEPEDRPLFIIAASLGPDCQAWAANRRRAAEEILRSIAKATNIAGISHTDLQLGGDPAILTTANLTMDDRPKTLVQTLRFRDCRYLRTVGIAPAAQGADYRQEFAELAKGVRWRAPKEATPMPRENAN
jgi:hypothetical protein